MRLRQWRSSRWRAKTDHMDERIAQCGCGRLKVRVQGEPLFVAACHCDFCQKHTGSAFRVSSFFGEDQIVEITGDPNVYNGLEIDGVGLDGSDEYGTAFHFCGTCGSTVYWITDLMPGSLWHLSGELRRSRFPATDHGDLDRAPPPLGRPDPGRRRIRTLPVVDAVMATRRRTPHGHARSDAMKERGLRSP